MKVWSALDFIEAVPATRRSLSPFAVDFVQGQQRMER